MDSIEIGDRRIGPDQPTFVIAEAGSNHNGDLETAMELIDAAAAAGVDAVKFQTFRADRLYVEDSGDVDHVDDAHDIMRSMEMPYEWIPKLHEHCRDRGVQFMSTPFDSHSASELDEFVSAWKVASYTTSHIPFLEHLSETDKPIIMSTGAHALDEIEEAVRTIRDGGVSDLVLLQCVAAYPTPLSDINVGVIETLRERFGVPAGLSDHTLDPVTAPAAAAAIGGCVVEKHFTLDTSMQGPDHEFALEPDELQRMVTAIRETETALGTGEKRVLDVERELHDKARRAVQATADIEAGDEFTQRNIGVLRPGEQRTGLHPRHYTDVLGKSASRDIEKGRGILEEDIID